MQTSRLMAKMSRRYVIPPSLLLRRISFNTFQNQITFVGQVISTSQKTTNILYKIDDGTGIVEVMQWISSDIDPSTAKPVAAESEYIRVWGRLKAFNNKR